MYMYLTNVININFCHHFWRYKFIFCDAVIRGCRRLLQSIAAENEKASCDDHMVNLVTTLTSLFERGVRSAFPDVSVAIVVTPAAQEKFGDYQCNSAMNIAQVVVVSYQ